MNKKTKRLLINGIAILTMLLGALGMIFCLPFLWSSRIEDLVGAGFPFLAGAILFGTGLVTIGIMCEQELDK